MEQVALYALKVALSKGLQILIAKKPLLTFTLVGVAVFIAVATGHTEEAEPGSATPPPENSGKAGSRSYSPVQAGQRDALRHGIAACAPTGGDLARLACYDKLAAQNGL